MLPSERRRARSSGQPGGDPQLADDDADRLGGPVGARRQQKGAAMPHAAAPSARHFAQSTPSCSLPDAGQVGAASNASASASTVPNPQSTNAAATAPARSSLRPSTSAQLVPPAPATSIAATPVPRSAATSAPARP